MIELGKVFGREPNYFGEIKYQMMMELSKTQNKSIRNEIKLKLRILMLIYIAFHYSARLLYWLAFVHRWCL